MGGWIGVQSQHSGWPFSPHPSDPPSIITLRCLRLFSSSFSHYKPPPLSSFPFFTDVDPLANAFFLSAPFFVSCDSTPRGPLRRLIQQVSDRLVIVTSRSPLLLQALCFPQANPLATLLRCLVLQEPA